MEMNIDPEEYSNWDIVKATQYGILPRCKELVEGGYDVRSPDAENITLLHWAAINNRQDIARYYISAGAVVDVLGGDLMATPMHWAIREGHLPMVVLLMQYGADPNVRDAEGCASIHVAVQCSHSNIVAYLIAKGVDPDLYDANGKTPLMWATWRTFGIDPTRMLLSMHASVNFQDEHQHNTPLHYACMSQNSNVLMALVNAGADLEAKNNRGETPLDIARMKKNVWIISKLTAMRKDKGLDSRMPTFLRGFNTSQWRKRAALVTAFFAIFSVGFIFNISSATWLLKCILLVLAYGFIHVMAMFCVTQHEMVSTFPICISFATKFWVYMTSFFFFWPVISSMFAQLLFLIFTPAMWYFFYKAMMTDPGIISCQEEQKKRTIIRAAETDSLMIEKFCSTCMVMKPLRSKHCAVTNKCIAKFDHFCPWVYNTVGAGNHRYFIGYLFFLLGMLTWNVWASFQYWHVMCAIPKGSTMLEQLTLIPRCSPWVFWIFANCVFHTVWVFLLLSCQLYQIVWLGVTTNERMNASRYAHFRTSDHGHLEKSPYNRGFLNNTADFFECSLLGLLRPVIVDWKTKMEFGSEFSDPMKSKIYETV
ncbi:palmitoyltransferase ZDHHC17-like [Styela clava]